jgi:uncharacterized RDD family membrane protein YckC
MRLGRNIPEEPARERLLARLIDIGIMVLAEAALMAVALVLVAAWVQSESEDGLSGLAGVGIFLIAAICIAIFGTLFYAAGTELLMGGTPGNRVMGLRVLLLNGRRPSVLRLVFRSIVQWSVPVIAAVVFFASASVLWPVSGLLVVGWLIAEWMTLSRREDGRSVTDLACGTIVVSVK